MTPTPRNWQRPIINALVHSVESTGVGIAATSTGSGKTLLALWASQRLGRTPFIVAPKITLTAWRRHAESLGISIIDVLNIEKLRTGRTPYLMKRTKSQFIWRLDPEQHLIIFDEAHGLTGEGTQNASILAATKQLIRKNGIVSKYEIPTILLSATLIDSPLRLRDALGYRLGLHNRADGGNWCLRNGCFVRLLQTKHGTRKFIEFHKGPAKMPYLTKLRDQLFPRFGACLKAEDIPDFPESQLIVETYDLPPVDLKDLRGIYGDLAKKRLDAEIEGNTLPERIHARQMSELLKVNLFTELTKEHLENGNSVVIFLNFRHTGPFDILRDLLKEHNPCLVCGGQTQRERDEHVRRFQQDETRVALVMVQAGGVGVELSDTRGEYPRVTLMSPPESALHLTQALGRCVRLNTVSKTVQYLVLAAGTVEEKIKKNLDNKLENMDLIQDSDFDVTQGE